MRRHTSRRFGATSAVSGYCSLARPIHRPRSQPICIAAWFRQASARCRRQLCMKPFSTALHPAATAMHRWCCRQAISSPTRREALLVGLIRLTGGRGDRIFRTTCGTGSGFVASCISSPFLRLSLSPQFRILTFTTRVWQRDGDWSRHCRSRCQWSGVLPAGVPKTLV